MQSDKKANKMLANIMFLCYRKVLVHWEEEGSVRAVPSGCIDKPVVGERKIVK